MVVLLKQIEVQTNSPPTNLGWSPTSDGGRGAEAMMKSGFVLLDLTVGQPTVASETMLQTAVCNDNCDQDAIQAKIAQRPTRAQMQPILDWSMNSGLVEEYLADEDDED